MREQGVVWTIQDSLGWHSGRTKASRRPQGNVRALPRVTNPPLPSSRPSPHLLHFLFSLFSPSLFLSQQ